MPQKQNRRTASAENAIGGRVPHNAFVAITEGVQLDTFDFSNPLDQLDPFWLNAYLDIPPIEPSDSWSLDDNIPPIGTHKLRRVEGASNTRRGPSALRKTKRKNDDAA